MSTCPDCRCIKFGARKVVSVGAKCGESNRPEVRGINVWKFARRNGEKKATADSREIGNLTRLALSNTNYHRQDVVAWLDYVDANLGDTLLELSSDSNPAKNGKFFINSVGIGEEVTYRGFKFIFKTISGDDPSINQIFIYEATTTPTFDIGDDTDEDDLTINNIQTSGIIALLILYGDDNSAPLSNDQINTAFMRYVDNVIYNGSSLATISQMRDNFKSNISAITTGLPLVSGFEFISSDGDESFVISPSGGSGSGLELQVTLDDDLNYVLQNINNAGTGYSIMDIMTETGINGGSSPTYDLTISVSSVGLGGDVTGVSLNGVGFKTEIDDGGDDQYDGGNRLNNQGNNDLAYTFNNQIISDSFGSGSQYVTAYRNSVFHLAVTGNSSNTFFMTGGTGSDGDGDVGGGQGGSGRVYSLTKIYGSGRLDFGEIINVNFLMNTT